MSSSKGLVFSAEEFITQEAREPSTKESSGRQKRRDKLDLIIGMLEATKEPVKKTRLLYQTAMNHEQVTRYLGLLLRHGMVEYVPEPVEAYVITDTGRTLLALFGVSSDGPESSE